MTPRVTERNHPSVILQEEIQHCGQKVRICRPRPQLAQIRSGGGQEQRKQLVFRSNPLKGLQRKYLRSFRLQFACPPLARKGHCPGNMLSRRETERNS